MAILGGSVVANGLRTNQGPTRKSLLLLVLSLILFALFASAAHSRIVSRVDRSWSEVHAVNVRAADFVTGAVSEDASCALLATSSATRGYLNLLMNSSVVEWVATADQAQELASSGGHCITVWIEQAPLFTDMPRISQVLVIRERSVWVWLSGAS